MSQHLLQIGLALEQGSIYGPASASAILSNFGSHPWVKLVKNLLTSALPFDIYLAKIARTE
jgi:hypothetical protein